MKKILKIVSIVVLSLILLVLSAAIIIPIVFKEDIIEAVKGAANDNLNAYVEFQADDFDLSLFTNFPDVTMEINNLSIVGKGKHFEGDTLVAFKSFSAGLDVWSVIGGDKIMVNGVYLDQPFIQALVNKEGVANYMDILIPSEEEEEVEEDTAAAEFSVAIKEWAITDAKIIYDDKPGNTYAEIVGLTHRGSGDFNDQEFLLTTLTEIKAISAEYEGVSYLNKNTFDAKLDLEIADNYSKYTFKENLLKLNEFAFGFDGWLLLADEYMDMDMTFEAKETEFKNILSLVPAVFLTDFDKIETSGSLAFNGSAKGKMEGDKVPAFDVTLLVNEGYFKYPDLPSAVSNVTVDFNAKSTDGIIDNMIVDLKKFHMMLGKNPVDAKAKVAGLTDMDIDALVNAQFNLADIETFYPLDGIKLKGLFNLDLAAKGKYNEAAGSLPSVNAGLGLKNGSVGMEGVPEMKNMNVSSALSLPQGSMAAGSFNLKFFDFELEGQKFHADAFVKNFDNYSFSGNANGKLDMDKIMALYPLEGMTLTGIIDVQNLNFKGNQEAIDAERYQDVAVGGKVAFENFKYTDEEYLPNGFSIASGVASFNPENLIIEQANGYLGNSDYNINGKISNYMGYVFSEDDSVLVGVMDMHSKKFDVDEWMYEDPEAVAASTVEGLEEEPLEIVPLPENIDFTFDAELDEVIYDDMDITDLNGQIVLRDGTVYLKDTKFKAIGGSFIMSGSHSTKDPDHPNYDFKMKIDNLEFNKAYQTFSFIKEYIPGLDGVEGAFNLDMALGGDLDQEYMPIYETMLAKGTADIMNAALTNTSIMDQVGKLANLTSKNSADGGKKNEIGVNDTKIGFRIEDGMAIFNPFKAKAGNIDMDIAGKNGLDGSLDWGLDMLVPSGDLGNAVNDLSSKYIGTKVAGDKVKMKAKVVGTYDSPKVKLIGTDGSETTASVVDAGKQAAKEEVKKQIDNTKAKAVEECLKEAEKQGADIMKTAQENADQITKEAEKNANGVRGEGDVQSNKVRSEANYQAQKLIDEAKNPIAKKLAQETAKGIRSEGEKNAKKVEAEYDKQAQEIENTAQKEVDKIMNEAKKEVEKLKANCNQ